MLQHICRLLSSKALRKTCLYYVHRQKIYDSIFLVPSPAVFWMSHFLFMSSFLEDRICTMGYPYFQNNAKNYSITVFAVFAQISGRRRAAYKTLKVSRWLAIRNFWIFAPNCTIFIQSLTHCKLTTA